MSTQDTAARAEILARLAATRAEVRNIFEPPPPEAGATAATGVFSGFPRSRTMQMLMSGRGLGTVGALAAGLLMARPALALRLLRMIPAGAVARTLLMRTLTGLRSKKA